MARTGYSCRNCGAAVRWSEDYCYTCAQLPVRTCADCGTSGRFGQTTYVTAQAAEWTEVRTLAEAPYHPWAPKAIKVRATDVKHRETVIDPKCTACDSTRMQPLVFGQDRLPEGQRACAAWPASPSDPFATAYGRFAGVKYKNWMKGAETDPRLALSGNRCTSCGLTFQLGDSEARTYGGSESSHRHDKCPSGQAYLDRMAADPETPETLHADYARIAVANAEYRKSVAA